MSVSSLSAISARLDKIADFTGHSAAWLALALVLVTFAVVTLRYLLEIGSIALQESILYLHASLFMLGAAYTLKTDGHVRVDIFYRRFSNRGRALVDLLGTVLLLLPVCGFLVWISWDYVSIAWTLREGSRETGGLPLLYLLKTLIPLSAALLILQGVSMLLTSVVTLVDTGTEN